MKKIFCIVLLLSVFCQLINASLKINLTRELSPTKGDNSLIQNTSFLAATSTQQDKIVTLTNYFQLKYFGTIYVGNKKQKMKVLFDTGSDTMWISTKNCSSCKSSGMTSQYECAESDGCKSAGIPAETLKYTKGQVDGVLVNTPVSLNPDQSAQNFSFSVLLINSVQNLESYDADGLIGLTYQVNYRRQDSRNTFIKSLYQSKTISDESFSIYLGFKKDDSEITFGGINQDKILTNAKMIYYLVPDLQGLYWEVPAQILKIGDKTIDLSSDTTIVDSGTSVLCFEPKTYSQVEEYLKANVKGIVKKDLLFTYTCGESLPTIYITLESVDKKNYRYAIEEVYYSLKLNGECTILIDSCPRNNILGDVFMRKYVTHFKYGYDEKHDAIGFAQSIANPDDNYLNDSEEEDKTLIYILIGIGAAVLILIGLLIYYAVKKRNMKKQLLLQKQEKQIYLDSSQITQQTEKRLSAISIQREQKEE